MDYKKQSGSFLTLADGVKEYYEMCGVDAAVNTADERDAAMRLIYGGCQVFGFALANIKAACDSDPLTAMPMILALYKELEAYARKAIEEDEAREKAQEEDIIAKRAAWPFPTGAKP